MQATYEPNNKSNSESESSDDINNVICQPFEDNKSHDNPNKYALTCEDQIYTISERNESSEATMT